MLKYCFFCYIIVILTSNLYSQNISSFLAEEFSQSLINDSNNLERFVYPLELEYSNRLGITYEEQKYKFIISNDLDPSIKTDLAKGKLKHKITIDSLNGEYSKVILHIPSKEIINEYYFYNSYLISKPFYSSRDWKIKISRFFNFHISDTTLFNEYSINKLDSFVEKMLRFLEFSENEINRLQSEKIHYYLCKDENEIETLTNFRARGMYFIPYDYIISTYSTHFHEILHLLINYKLKSVSLYTLPLLQEGFAVAYGGRGGKEPDVILGLGKFLSQSGFLNYEDLLTRSKFYQTDASLSYPLSGLYVKFLITELGINKFLEIYKNYSGDLERVKKLNLIDYELPTENSWKEFIDIPELRNRINVQEIDQTKYQSKIVDSKNIKIFENSDEYLFKIKHKIGLTIPNSFTNYKSKYFSELFPNGTYRNEKYIINVSEEEISVYNFYNNILVAKYTKGFSINQKTVTNKNGLYLFTIKKYVFDEPLSKYQIREIGSRFNKR